MRDPLPPDGHEKPMLTDLAAIREARTPWWVCALASIRAWRARVAARLQPVPEGECANCHRERAEAERWRGVADGWAEKARGSDAKLDAAILRAERAEVALLRSCESEEHQRTKAQQQQALVRDLERRSSPASGQAARREQYALDRVGKPATHLDPEAEEKLARPLPPIMRTATARRRALETGVPAEESAVFRGPGCHRKDGKPALTNAEIMARVRGQREEPTCLPE